MFVFKKISMLLIHIYEIEKLFFIYKTLINGIPPPKKIKLFDYKFPEKKFTRTTIFISCLYDPCLGKGKANHENQNLFIRRGSGPKKIGERTHF